MSDTPNPGEQARSSSQRRTAAVLRLLRAENLELVLEPIPVGHRLDYFPVLCPAY
jgi:hypothetical protein